MHVWPFLFNGCVYERVRACVEGGGIVVHGNVVSVKMVSRCGMGGWRMERELMGTADAASSEGLS
jgi:hypothetical protein